jgi:hypothetical protein
MAKKVLMVTEANSGDEAMYIDGVKVLEDSTIYACDLAAGNTRKSFLTIAPNILHLSQMLSL